MAQYPQGTNQTSMSAREMIAEIGKRDLATLQAAMVTLDAYGLAPERDALARVVARWCGERS